MCVSSSLQFAWFARGSKERGDDDALWRSLALMVVRRIGYWKIPAFHWHPAFYSASYPLSPMAPFLVRHRYWEWMREGATNGSRCAVWIYRGGKLDLWALVEIWIKRKKRLSFGQWSIFYPYKFISSQVSFLFKTCCSLSLSLSFSQFFYSFFILWLWYKISRKLLCNFIATVCSFYDLHNFYRPFYIENVVYVLIF